MTGAAKPPALLHRREVVAWLVRDRTDLVVISGLGSPSYDLAAAGDRDRNFYLWGAMGGALALGLGVALARPDIPVLVLTGDGEALMGMGSFATIALKRPGNLSVCILDNAMYGETGGQPSHTAGPADLAAIARGCGIADARRLRSAEEVAAFAARVHRTADAPAVAVADVDGEDLPRVLPSRDAAHLTMRLRAALGLPSL